MGKSFITSISFPKAIAEEIEEVAKKEQKTKSGVVQDAVRQYLELRKWQKAQIELSARARKMGISSEEDIEELVDEVRR